MDTPSPWVCRFAPLIPTSGEVLDVACGEGRHVRYLAQRGLRVEAVDIDAAAIAMLSDINGVHARVADLEYAPWPYAGRQFAAVVVTNYLHRPLLPCFLAVLAPGGLLIYETFAEGNERYGRPRNPDFLLKRGELLEYTRGHTYVLAYEHLYVEHPKAAMVQHICAVRE